MASNNWKHELNRMLDSFANQAESSLEIINQEFKAMSRTFDEDFRQYFLKMSNLRLDSSYTKIALNHWDECQIETRNQSSRGHQMHQTVQHPDVAITNHRMDDSISPAKNGEEFLLVPKNENQNDLIEIVDSDDESDFVQTERQEMMTQHEETVDENGSNVSMQESCGGDTNGEDKTIKDEPDASANFEIMDANMPLITFDPRRSSAESDGENVVSSPSKGQSGKTPKTRPPTKQIQSIMKRTAIKHLKCKQCEYATNHSGHFKKHQNVHVLEKSMGVARDSNNLYHCTLCVRQFTNICHLSFHMKKSHKNNQYLFDCVRCTRQFTRKSDKDRHESQCDGRLYECHLCKVFVTKGKWNMENHMRTHSGTRPFRCMVCDKSFHQKSNLRRHLNSIHGQFNQ